MACCISIAQRTASAALGNTTISPSPRFLTSWPPRWSTASRRSRKCARRTVSAASSPMRLSNSVEPTMSVNSSVTVPSTADLSVGVAKCLDHHRAQLCHPQVHRRLTSFLQQLPASLRVAIMPAPDQEPPPPVARACQQRGGGDALFERRRLA